MDDKCRKIDELLTEAMSRELSPAEQQFVDEHCASCPECATLYKAVLTARGLLKRHRPADDAAPDDLRATLHRRLVEEQAQQAERSPAFGWRWNLIAGTAAGILLIVLACFAVPALTDRTDEATILSKTEVSAKEPLTIRMIYTADRPLADVRVTVRLDEGIVFSTDNEKLRSLREYTWTGDLQAGANEIPFAVEVQKMGTRLIRTEAAYEGYLHRHDVELQADRETVVLTYLSYQKKPI